MKVDLRHLRGRLIASPKGSKPYDVIAGKRQHMGLLGQELEGCTSMRE